MYASFENAFLDTLNKHAPLKKKVIRANNEKVKFAKDLFKKRRLNH